MPRKRASISSSKMAALVGWDNDNNIRRLEMSPDKNGARAPKPALWRLMLLLWWQKKTTGELPDFNKIEQELIKEIEHLPEE